MKKQNDLPIIALSCGDPAGIGPELCIKAAVSEDILSISRPIVYGDSDVLILHAESCGLDIQFDVQKAPSKFDWSNSGVKVIELDQFKPKKFEFGQINAANGRASVEYGTAAIQAAISGQVAAVVAGPQTQKSIQLAGIKFDGYPSFVARQTGLTSEDCYLMICFDKYRVAHVTLHQSIRQSLDLITEDRIKHIISVVHETLIKIGIKQPKILVSGLNPHAGERGLFGSEEVQIIRPAILNKRAQGIDVNGPVAPDLLFNQKNYDAFIVMLHDHGHIPAKLLARHNTIALSIGSPVLFSSVAHGSAHDIAGKGIAEPSAVVQAVHCLLGIVKTEIKDSE